MSEAQDQSGIQPSKPGATGTLVLLAIALIGVALLVKGLYPADLSPHTDSDFVNSIFHNKGVILAARLLLVSAAVVLAVGGVFIVLSVAIRMKKGEWLRKAGPFEIAETEVSHIESQIERWREAAEAGEEEVEELTKRIEDSDELMKQLKERPQQEQGN